MEYLPPVYVLCGWLYRFKRTWHDVTGLTRRCRGDEDVVDRSIVLVEVSPASMGPANLDLDRILKTDHGKKESKKLYQTHFPEERGKEKVLKGLKRWTAAASFVLSRGQDQAWEGASGSGSGSSRRQTLSTAWHGESECLAGES